MVQKEIRINDPFGPSRDKIDWAKKHIADLKREILNFTSGRHPYERVIEPHPDKVDHTIHKIKLVRPIPPLFSFWLEMLLTISETALMERLTRLPLPLALPIP